MTQIMSPQELQELAEQLRSKGITKEDVERYLADLLWLAEQHKQEQLNN